MLGSEAAAAWRARIDARRKSKRSVVQAVSAAGACSAGNAICWASLKAGSARCNRGDCRLLHLNSGTCIHSVEHMLGQRSAACDACAFHSLSREVLLQQVAGWWGTGYELVESGDTEAARPAAPPAMVPALACEECEPCASSWHTDVEFWRGEIARRHPGNGHLQRLVGEAWFSALLCDEGGAKLWRGVRRRLLKELTEARAAACLAYAVVCLVRRALQRVGLPADGQEGGSGAVIFDVCAGRGIVVRCHLLDIFQEGALERLAQHYVAGECGGGFAWGCAVGTHLCGALSARLVSFFGSGGPLLRELVLSPCCLKGWLGKEVQRQARELHRPHYEVLVSTLAELVRAACRDAEGEGGSGCADSSGSAAEVEVREWYDAAVLSEKNGFERAAALATSLRRCGLDACYLRRGGADSLAKLLGRLPAGGSLLAVGREGTSLHAAGGGPPLRLHAGIAAKRLRNAGAAGFQDSLLAACELRAGEVVIDATAGLLGDALVAAHAVGPGGRVVAMESIPLLHAVTSGSPSTLGDARADEALGRVSVLLGDHTALLRSMPDESADVVFFDAAPAYAGLRSLADHRPLSAEAVRQAVRVARRRVVVMDAAAGEELERLGVPLYHRSQRKRFGPADSPAQLLAATCVCRDEVREALAQLRRSRKGRREEARVGDGQAAAGAEVCNDLVAAMSCCIRIEERAFAACDALRRDLRLSCGLCVSGD
ncbi:hypothetical protein EMIHUDRAFT_249317 [Emiliania huxleyi CCMP1516]|uniref:C3H1-type domain-containing protein n=2 Tax=Emiliania huxleyi TaxID=2903 RepID=A0A0D3I9D0_EMIH1|nr:hypothetical protein EMIHUDRAFT_249317 [Emiliania huxleyi CCMP1516]EOD07865.1 hypothetical protein EMIHUDRAFT_249317 [Emiliania huxleyi CCMP1516]|eukprot:XP_005760294.1 hypothetical protein EMIHUDRAFT_249317 [Emiliania huxleyi CCMP1516]